MPNVELQDALHWLWFVVPPFVATALATKPLIGWLARRQLGKTIRADVPMHQGKAGTPTMGGLALVATVVIGVAVSMYLAFITVHDFYASSWPMPDDVRIQLGWLYRGLGLTAAAVAAFGSLGLFDDWQGLARKERVQPLGIGLGARAMFGLQLAVAAGLAWAMRPIALAPPWSQAHLDGIYGSGAARPALAEWMASLLLPPAEVAALISTPLWLAFGTLAIVAIVNGVNLSDGLDGLAAGLAAIAFAGLGWALINWFAPLGRFELQGWVAKIYGALALWTSGACLGFLVHNRYPARVFMGNVTSMALGGALATIALASGAWPLLPLIGIVYVAEVASDVIQVGYFKWSGGKRVFRMAPIHHHFELLGWHETVVTRRFWLVGAIGAAAAVGFVWWASAGVW